MVNSNRLAEVVAMIAERDQEFADFNAGRMTVDGKEETIWKLSYLKSVLGYEEDESIQKAVDRAKIAASTAGIMIKENFIDGDLFSQPGDIYVTKYAALMIVMEADVRKENVALAKNYFALQVDKQWLEDEKRLKARLDVTTENNNLTGVAQEVGVKDFAKFNGMGIYGLYGNRNKKQIQQMKGLKPSQHYLDYAGSEELAANLFRITQTAGALRRQECQSEELACHTHKRVGEVVRKAILDAGNTPPELLPKAAEKVDTKVATRVKKKLQEPN